MTAAMIVSGSAVAILGQNFGALLRADAHYAAKRRHHSFPQQTKFENLMLARQDNFWEGIGERHPVLAVRE
ncbi:MAG: hypothetical protein ACLP4V_28140, partial [Methylocella sp.]